VAPEVAGSNPVSHTMDTLKVRFVGGSKDNQLLVVQPVEQIQVPLYDMPLVSGLSSQLGNLGFPKYEKYYLTRQRTEYGTLFCEYIHESLFR
jgi:hypothetical protein